MIANIPEPPAIEPPRRRRDQTGIAAIPEGRSRHASFNVEPSRGAFYLFVFCRAAFASFAIAVVLNAFGMIGDPFVWMHHNLPFLMPG
jgi:hypothetical protein